MKILENPLFAVFCTDCGQLYVLRLVEDDLDVLRLEPTYCERCKCFLPLMPVYEEVEKMQLVPSS